MKEENKFKILKGYGESRTDIPDYFPWSLLNEKNAQKFHSQTLERLNERGGLTCEEIYCNVMGIDPVRHYFDVGAKQVVLKWIKQKVSQPK